MSTEDLTNALIEAAWPHMDEAYRNCTGGAEDAAADMGKAKDEVQDALHNVFDAWQPPPPPEEPRAVAPINGELRVWWIPQVPGDAFHTPVKTIAEAKLLIDTMSRYDMFQFEQKIKPDYSNAGGLEVWDGTEWLEWLDEDGDDIETTTRT